MSSTLPRRPLAVVAGFLLLACAHAPRTAASDGGAPSGPIQLKFAWPDGFQSHVLIAHESRRRGSEPTGLVARQRLVTEKRGNEIWVFTRDIAARGNEPELESTVKINEALVQVVATDGRFQRAEGLDQALSIIKTSTPDERENVRQALIRSAASDWELMVGAWAGERLKPGEVHRKQVKASVPLLATIATLLDVEYSVEGRVPCTEEDTVRGCVALSYRARIAPEERAATVERLRRATSPKPDEPVPEDVHADLEMLLISEPDTLVPHRISQREHLRVRVRLHDGRVLEAEDRSEDAYIFSDRPPSVTAPENAPRDV